MKAYLSLENRDFQTVPGISESYLGALGGCGGGWLSETRHLAQGQTLPCSKLTQLHYHILADSTDFMEIVVLQHKVSVNKDYPPQKIKSTNKTPSCFKTGTFKVNVSFFLRVKWSKNFEIF